MFADDEFLPGVYNLPDCFQSEDVRWLRPLEICKKPVFCSDSPSDDPFERRNEVIKGHNGGFFLAAVAGLTGYPDRFDMIVVPGQKFGGEEYEGKFKFQFFEASGAEPTEVVIDDRLPTINGKLIFAQAPGGIFWCALLEKAYAKFRGGYKNLNLDEMSTSLLHLTGLSTITFLSDTMLPSMIHSRLSEYISNDQIICCKHKHDNGNNLEYGTGCTVTGMGIIGKDYMIRVRDVTKNEEETMKMMQFKEAFDVIVVTVEDEAEKRKKSLKIPLTETFDENGRLRAMTSVSGIVPILQFFEGVFSSTFSKK